MPGRGDARRRQPVDQGAELELAQPLGNRPAVIAPRPRRFEVELHREVGHDAAHRARQEGRLAMLGQSLAELPLDLVEVLVQVVERVELLKQ
jgi:hypothetical protein